MQNLVVMQISALRGVSSGSPLEPASCQLRHKYNLYPAYRLHVDECLYMYYYHVVQYLMNLKGAITSFTILNHPAEKYIQYELG
jgi:hypothetical protein